ncbi:MAG: translation initiation factor IF-5A [Candidatus Altiarchaeota archaeon]|nr:translation initiation factor IF-5A [Candidatus Altiarchaeota archaeon]
MEKRIIDVKTLKPGRYIMMEDVPCKIIGMTHSKPGKHGGARVRIDAVGVFDDSKRNLIKPAGDKVEAPVLEKKVAQVLAVLGDKLQMMDMTSYETFDLPMPDEQEMKAFIREGAEIMYITWGAQKKITQAKGSGE